jgi:hypothetical protein
VVDLRFLSHLVDPEGDAVGDPPTLDHRLALHTVEGEGHRDDRLEGVALGAAGRAGIGFARGDPDREVQDVGYRLGRDSRSVVGDSDLAGGDINADRRRNAGFLGSVEGVVGQLLKDDDRPMINGMTDLLDELPFGAEVEQARRPEGLALQQCVAHATASALRLVW